MKVFIAGTSLSPRYGGPAYSVARLSTALAESGVSVALWSPDGTAASTKIVEEKSGVATLGGSLHGAVNEFGRPDIMHDNGIWMPHNHAFATLAQKRGIPRVVSPRGMLEPWAMGHKRFKKEVAWRVYQRRDLAAASLLHATSETEAANLALRDLGPPIEMIPNGVDVPEVSTTEKLSLVVTESPEFPTSREARRTALFLGRLYPVKGLPMLLSAWNTVRPPGWRLLLAGPDEAGHRRELESLIASYTLGETVSFAGPVEGKAKEALFLGADLFVLPSYSESFGMSVAEAFAFGLPVITTTGTPWRDMEEIGCGWCVAPDSSAIADALREATSSTAGRLRDMGTRGRDLVLGRYRWERIAAAFIGAYNRLV